MAAVGPNLAVTRDGAKYNKLTRPDDFIAGLAAPNPDIEEAPVSAPRKTTESTKRTLDEADNGDGSEGEESRKRTRIARGTVNSKSRSKARQPLDMDYGMHSMFPGMVDDGDMSDESTNEALAYLRSVRTEASSIPQLLVAPRNPEDDREMYNNGYGDHRAIFKDGTYIARDIRPTGHTYGMSSHVTEDLDPQEQYYRKLLWRYEAMRKKLEEGIPTATPVDTASDNPNRMATEVPRNRHAWLWTLDRLYPTPAVLSQMDERDVFHGLKYCAHSLNRFSSISKHKSCWIWSLLAKAPEAGTLDYVKVGCIRDLGHKAGQFGNRLRSGAEEDPGAEGEEEDAEYWEPDEVGAEEDVEDVAEDIDIDSVALDTKSDNTKPRNNAPGPEDVTTTNNENTPAIPDGPDPASEAEMSISSDDGEIHEDEPATLEEAKARLLAQLGDRLVHSDSNPSTLSAPSARGFPSRAEAEAHRQKLREETLKNDTSTRKDVDMPDTQPEPEFPATKTKVSIDDIEIPDMNTKVTLDMILTVVAECYGQKDLLRFRDIWVT